MRDISRNGHYKTSLKRKNKSVEMMDGGRKKKGKKAGKLPKRANQNDHL